MLVHKCIHIYDQYNFESMILPCTQNKTQQQWNWMVVLHTKCMSQVLWDLVQHFYHTRIIGHNPRERYATISGINIAGCFNIPCQSPQWWQCQYRIPSRIWSNTQLSLNSKSLQWRHNGHDSVSNHQPHHCFPFIQTQIKENTKASRHWPLCGELTGNRWIPRTNGQLRGKCFHLMTSS